MMGLGQLGGSLLTGGMMLFSSREFKDVGEELKDDAITMVEDVPAHVWRYRENIVDEWIAEGEEHPIHVGPMAEDFSGVTGIGDGVTIPVTDMVGILWAAVGALSKRVRELEEKSA